MNREKLRFIDILYGIGAILVIFGHSHPIHGEYPDALHQVIDFIYLFHMPLFFFISGILVRYSSNGKQTSVWLKRRLYKLGIPYLVLSLLGAIPKILLSKYLNDDMALSAGNILKILFSPRDNIWGHFWFIPVILVLSFVAFEFNKALIRLEKREGNTPIIIVSLASLGLSIVLCLFPIQTDWFGICDICKGFFYELLGVFFCMVFVEKADYQFAKWPLSLFFSVVAVTLYIAFTDNAYVRFIISVLMLFVLVSFSILIEKRKMSLIRYIGSHAFSFFLYSWPAQAVVELLVVSFLKQNWYISFPALFLTGLVVPFIIYEGYCYFVKNPNRFFDAVIGVVR